jgi:amino acid permease
MTSLPNQSIVSISTRDYVPGLTLCRGIRVFGELEFWFSSIKVIALISLILFGIIVDLGGNPKGDRIGFRYWWAPK